MHARGGGGRRDFERRVRALEGLGHRGSATEHEERAADYLVGELEGLGIAASKESFSGSDSLGARLLVHVAVAGLGLALHWVAPVASLLLAAIALASLAVESEARGIFVLSRFIRRRPSRNVVARIAPPGGQGPRHTIILCAHMDTQRTGLIWGDRLAGPIAPLLQKLPGPVRSPMFIVVAAMVVQILLAGGALVASGEVVGSRALTFVAVVYIGAVALLFDWAKGAFVPGAADNASGAAAAVELASRWAADPVDGVELRLVLTGCEETGSLGAAAWIDAHRGELDQRRCTFLNVDTFGCGKPRFIDREHSLAARPHSYPPDLVDLARRVAERSGFSDAGPWVLPTYSDGLAFLSRGFRGMSVLTFEDGVRMTNMHKMTDTSEAMDFDVGHRAVEFSWELLRAIGRAPSKGEAAQSNVTPAAP